MSAKPENNETTSPEMRILERQALSERIADVTRELGRLQDEYTPANNIARDASNALGGLSPQLESSQREDGQARLKKLRDDADRAKQTVVNIVARSQLLRDELQELEQRSANHQHATSDKEVLAHQSAIAHAENYVLKLKGLMAQRDELLANARNVDDPRAELFRQRAKMLADVAAGEAEEKELAQLDSEISQRQTDWNAKQAKADAVIEQCEQTLLGLKEKLQSAEEHRNELRNLTPGVLEHYLLSKAEELYASYLTDARALVKSFERLVAIEHLVCDLREQATPIFLPQNWRTTLIHQMALGGNKKVHPTDPFEGAYFSADVPNFGNEANIEILKSDLKQWLRSQGLVIS